MLWKEKGNTVVILYFTILYSEYCSRIKNTALSFVTSVRKLSQTMHTKANT